MAAINMSLCCTSAKQYFTQKIAASHVCVCVCGHQGGRAGEVSVGSHGMSNVICALSLVSLDSSITYQYNNINAVQYCTVVGGVCLF